MFKRNVLGFSVLMSCLALLACESKGPPDLFMNASRSITLTSADFDNGAPMAAKHSCQGEDLSPALQWSGVPGGTKSLVLMMMDYDAPSPKFALMSFNHWILFNIPADKLSLPSGLTIEQARQLGVSTGTGSMFKKGYFGPCPPLGVHRYFFHLYALDTELIDLDEYPRRGALLKAMEGHVIGRGELMGTYKKQ